MTSTHTYVAVYNEIRFADPYNVCLACGGWITGVLDKPGRMLVMPCEHDLGFKGVCPSWGPVDGCWCEEVFGRVAHDEPPRKADDADA